jgi:hypothetical protein
LELELVLATDDLRDEELLLTGVDETEEDDAVELTDFAELEELSGFEEMLDAIELCAFEEEFALAAIEELAWLAKLLLEALVREAAVDESDDELLTTSTPFGAGCVLTKTDFTGDQLPAESPTLTP